jgi:hypothetical protein
MRRFVRALLWLLARLGLKRYQRVPSFLIVRSSSR